MKNKRILVILGTVVAILLVPMIAMQFTDQVNWTLTDFVIGGGLLLGAGLMLEGILRKFEHSKYKALIVAALVIAFLLIWAELAVGIFGTPFAGS